jgi:hypothetical protein
MSLHINVQFLEEFNPDLPRNSRAATDEMINSLPLKKFKRELISKEDAK